MVAFWFLVRGRFVQVIDVVGLSLEVDGLLPAVGQVDALDPVLDRGQPSGGSGYVIAIVQPPVLGRVRRPALLERFLQRLQIPGDILAWAGSTDRRRRRGTRRRR